MILSRTASRTISPLKWLLHPSYTRIRGRYTAMDTASEKWRSHQINSSLSMNPRGAVVTAAPGTLHSSNTLRVTRSPGKMYRGSQTKHAADAHATIVRWKLHLADLLHTFLEP